MKIKTIEVPIDPRSNKIPMITNNMKYQCIGEFEWKEEADYYNENGDVIEHVATRVVPWDICKKIYQRMAVIASNSEELQPAQADENSHANDVHTAAGGMTQTPIE